MSVTCRGWQQKHQVEQLIEVQIAYVGALNFPSRYSMCADCIAKMQTYVNGVREKHGPASVAFFVDGESY